MQQRVAFGWIAGLMIFVLLIGSALVIEGRPVWFGAGVLSNCFGV